MICDDLCFISQYDVPEEVIKFIEGLNVNTPTGRYDICENIYANIEEYNTKSELDATLESHKRYVDIQFLLNGVERINYCSIDGLVELTNYSYQKDIVFYHRPKMELNKLYLNSKNFAIFYPQDAHAPQITTMCLQDNVKKVVVKIGINQE